VPAINCNNRTTRKNNRESMGSMRGSAWIVLIAALLIEGGCTSAPRFTGHPTEPAPERAEAPAWQDSGVTSERGESVVDRAEDYLGTPYRNGGTSPSGVDCSGLTYSVFQSVGIRLPRSSSDQARVGEAIARSELSPGDLVFFGSGGTSISHVGIYAGDGEFIHASTRARSVRFDRLDNKYFANRYVTARRVL